MASRRHRLPSRRLHRMNDLVNKHYAGNDGMPREMASEDRMLRRDAEENFMVCQDCSPLYDGTP